MIHPIEHRYGSPEMRVIFDDDSRWQRMIAVEVALAKALSKLGAIPKDAAKGIADGAKKVTVARIKEIEKETDHDVMAMVKALTEQCGKNGDYVHLTATSYDIVDNALALQLRDGLDIIIKKAIALRSTCAALAAKHADTVMVGRTHGQHAVPITLGFKFANYTDKLGHDIERLQLDRDECIRGKFSGAVGSYATQTLYKVQEKLEDEVMNNLGLKAAEISTQVTPRENFARIVCDLAVLASTAEQIGKEVRNLQRTEIDELSEPFGAKQVGSSTMAQKKNPIHSENVCGNARIVRSCVGPALEDIAIEHERDLTNSAAERSLLPTVFLLTEETVQRMDRVLTGLVVNKDRMRANLDITKGGIMAEAIMTTLVQRGFGRQDAHEVLRTASLAARKNDTALKDELLKDKRVKARFTPKELDKLLDYSGYTGRCAGKAREVAKKWK